MLLTCIGTEALERYNNFEYTADEDPKKYNIVIGKFDGIFQTLKRTVFSRYEFWTMKRGESQPFIDYLAALRTKASHCEFQEKDNMSRQVDIEKYHGTM